MTLEANLQTMQKSRPLGKLLGLQGQMFMITDVHWVMGCFSQCGSHLEY